jgi:protein tyrosine phosphatase (PTP) superfamily phosphohydrolase (DUF442 family)
MTKTHRWRSTCIVVLGFVLLAAAGGAEYVGAIGGNVRVVEPGLVYRGAQLKGHHLQSFLESRGIRSVVNLRGWAQGNADLREEAAICQRLGISHADVALSAVRLPAPDQLMRLLHAFDTLPRPMFIHCRGGADRSGLASALYLAIVKGVPLEQAVGDQLTWRYGHLRNSQAHPMDDFFDMYRSTSGGTPLRDWITNTYPKLYRKAQVPVQSGPMRLRQE